LRVILKPRQEGRLLCSGQASLVDPVVVRTHVTVNERAHGAKLGIRRIHQEQCVHSLLPLPRSEADQQRKRLRPAENFARCAPTRHDLLCSLILAKAYMILAPRAGTEKAPPAILRFYQGWPDY